ncbi:MAG: AAA domain-containing protein [Solibacillus sp.]
MTKKESFASVRCHILLTNTAREAMMQHVPDEHAFFNLQQHFLVYIEKLAVEESQLQVTLYFDGRKNKKLAQKFPERIVIMDCVFDAGGLLAKSFRTRGIGTPVATNRRAPLAMKFVPSRINGHTYPEKFIETLANLPIAQERFDYVNKRISSWEGYLKVLNKNADIEDIHATYSRMSFNADFTHMTLRVALDAKQWKQLKNLSARMPGFIQEVGQVVKVNRGESTVELELKPYIANLARKGELHFQKETVEFSNAATKSQLKRLLKGFERLKEGLAANANLETILFEDRPKIAARTANLALDFHNNLNEFQRAAVTGAMTAEDLYVIQGPPGTGKTTVISEICYQNAKAGLKTLVASQSNLAVDNALSRLLANKDIRILRYGRTESIEEDGKKFIEENVATHWQTVTHEAIRYEISVQQEKEQLLRADIAACEEAIEALTEQQITLTAQIAQKEAAKAELHVIAENMTALKKQLAEAKGTLEEKTATFDTLQQTYHTTKSTVDTLQQALAKFETPEDMDARAQKLVEQQQDFAEEEQLLQLQQQLARVTKRMQEVDRELTQFSVTSNEQFMLEKINELKKVHEIESFMTEYGISRNFPMDRLLTSLERVQPQAEKYKPLKAIQERLEKAILYSETTLGIRVAAPSLPPNNSYSLSEVDEFLSKLSRAFAERKVTKENGTRSVQGLHLRKAYLQQIHSKYMDYIRETLLIFEKLKEEISLQFKEKHMEKEASRTQFMQEKQQLQIRANDFNSQIAQFTVTVQHTAEELKQAVSRNDFEQQDLELKRLARTKKSEQLNEKESELVLLAEQLEPGRMLLEKLTANVKTYHAEGLTLERRREELEQLARMNPEQALATVEEALVAEQVKIDKLNTQIALLPVTQSLQNEWHTMLEAATAHDLDEIRKLYVKHANVIGTTCVASANKEFMDNYPTFDVVIIDEVSKATPPELLLPMLKGAKIILVGDHHQLPPLIGDETLEETLEQVVKESTTFEEKRELEKLLEESLFERLYKNLPDTNKTMLAIQYRMHANIMQTIAPFYKNENEELQCGLADSDAMRAHHIDSAHIQADNHLLWLDIPNEKGYFEQRMKEGASLFNEAELDKVKTLLLEINDATAKAKEQGTITADTLKSVGVISFYAEQVKRINRLLETLDIPHLHIRTGSVDKFQGMEMDVILVSMVRNNDGNGDIGFAKDYRRLNVALSRARQLLVLIGSTRMFTERPKQQKTREMYSRLLATVSEQNGYLTFEKV